MFVPGLACLLALASAKQRFRHPHSRQHPVQAVHHQPLHDEQSAESGGVRNGAKGPLATELREALAAAGGAHAAGAADPVLGKCSGWAKEAMKMCQKGTPIWKQGAKEDPKVAETDWQAKCCVDASGSSGGSSASSGGSSGTKCADIKANSAIQDASARTKDLRKRCSLHTPPDASVGFCEFNWQTKKCGPCGAKDMSARAAESGNQIDQCKQSGAIAPQTCAGKADDMYFRQTSVNCCRSCAKVCTDMPDKANCEAHQVTTSKGKGAYCTWDGKKCRLGPKAFEPPETTVHTTTARPAANCASIEDKDECNQKKDCSFIDGKCEETTVKFQDPNDAEDDTEPPEVLIAHNVRMSAQNVKDLNAKLKPMVQDLYKAVKTEVNLNLDATPTKPVQVADDGVAKDNGKPKADDAPAADDAGAGKANDKAKAKEEAARKAENEDKKASLLATAERGADDPKNGDLIVSINPYLATQKVQKGTLMKTLSAACLAIGISEQCRSADPWEYQDVSMDKEGCCIEMTLDESAQSGPVEAATEDVVVPSKNVTNGSLLQNDSKAQQEDQAAGKAAAATSDSAKESNIKKRERPELRRTTCITKPKTAKKWFTWTSKNCEATIPLDQQKALPERNWNGVASSADGSHVYSCESGHFWKSPDSGESWFKVKRKNHFAPYRIATSDGGDVLMALGYNASVWLSTNYGAKWEKVLSARNATKGNPGAQQQPQQRMAYYYGGLALSKDGQTAAAVFNSSGHIFLTQDGGSSWRQVTQAGSRYWTAVAVSATGNTIAAVESMYGDVWVSRDSGKNWASRTLGIGLRESKSLGAIAMDRSGNMMAIAGNFGGNIWVSEDYGHTWKDVDVADTVRNWESVVISGDGRVMVAVERPGSVWISRNYGQTGTWKETSVFTKGQNASALGWLSWEDVAISQNGMKMVAVMSPGGIWRTKNGGLDWNNESITEKTKVEEMEDETEKDGAHKPHKECEDMPDATVLASGIGDVLGAGAVTCSKYTILFQTDLSKAKDTCCTPRRKASGDSATIRLVDYCCKTCEKAGCPAENNSSKTAAANLNEDGKTTPAEACSDHPMGRVKGKFFEINGDYYSEDVQKVVREAQGLLLGEGSSLREAATRKVGPLCKSASGKDEKCTDLKAQKVYPYSPKRSLTYKPSDDPKANVLFDCGGDCKLFVATERGEEAFFDDKGCAMEYVKPSKPSSKNR
jgi:photosystem II stability/assembly factor-like uncharacterized protein